MTDGDVEKEGCEEVPTWTREMANRCQRGKRRKLTGERVSITIACGELNEKERMSQSSEFRRIE